MNGKWALGFGVALVFCTATAFGSPTQSGETGLATVPTTDVLDAWRPSAGVHLNGLAGSTGSGSHELWRTQFTLGLGLIEDLELTAQVPYIQFSRDVAGRRHTDDVGGVRLGGKYRLLNEEYGDWLSGALLAAVVIGNGRDSFPAILDRESAWGRREAYEVMAIADKKLFSAAHDDAVLTLNAGGLFFDQPEHFALSNQSPSFQRRFRGRRASFSNPFEFATALRLPIYATENFRIQLLEELRGNTGTVDNLKGSVPTRLFSGVRFAAANGMALQGGADFGLSGFLEPYRFMASFSYAMPEQAEPPVPVARAIPAPVALPTPATAAASPAEVLPPPVKRKVVLRGVKFDFAQSTIRPDSDAILGEAAAALKANPDVKVAVEGHTDSVGSDEYNLRLSIHRGLAVRERLEHLGILHERLSVRARGESQPVASNDTESGRAENRRVELLVE